MPPTTIHEAPTLDSFTPLADHQSQTPTSFYGAKPVLHFQAAGTRAIAPWDQVSRLPFFADGEHESTSADESSDRPVRVGIVDAYISSENLTLFNPASAVGLSIPYPSISLHAIQRLKDPADASVEVQGLYMQLELSSSGEDAEEEDELDAVELTLIPPTAPDGTATSIQSLFEAVSNCSNLHPDPAMQDDEEMGEDGSDSRIVFEGSVGYEGISGLPGALQGSTDGGLPPPFPGSGGWITAENVSDYFDEDGNWIAGADGEGEALGEGAGRVRTREEVEEVEEVEEAAGGAKLNGDGGHETDDHKRARTD